MGLAVFLEPLPIERKRKACSGTFQPHRFASRAVRSCEEATQQDEDGKTANPSDIHQSSSHGEGLKETANLKASPEIKYLPSGQTATTGITT
jgi:hypothetical protein